MYENLWKIIEHYGINNQQRKLEEEVFELQEAITKYEVKKSMKRKPTLKEIEEELADITVLLNEFLVYYNLDLDKIYDICDSKIERQIKRIDSENE